MACVAEASSTVTSGRVGAGSSAGADSVSAGSSAGADSSVTSVSTDATSAASTSADSDSSATGSSATAAAWALASSPRQSRQAYRRIRERRQASARYPWHTPRTQPPRGARRPLREPHAWGWAVPRGWACGYGSCCRHLHEWSPFLSLPLSVFPIHDTPPRTKKTAPKDRLSH